MTSYRNIIGLIFALMFSALSAVAMPLAPTGSLQVEFFPQHEATVVEHISPHFATRAPPMAVANVAFTGAAVAELQALGCSGADQETFNAYFAELARNNVDVAKLSGAFAAFLAGADGAGVNAAAAAGANAAQNNWVFLVVRAGLLAWTVYEVIDAGQALGALFDQVYADGELTAAEAAELRDVAAAAGITLTFEVVAGKVVKGLRIVEVAGGFTQAIARKLGLDDLMTTLNRKFDGVGGAKRTIGFSDDTVGTAFAGMREGHAIRHLQGDIIPNTGSLQSRVDAFKEVATPILTNPTKTAPWRVGATNGRAFLGSSNGKNVVVVVATDGPKQGKVITSFVPDSNQLSIINSR